MEKFNEEDLLSVLPPSLRNGKQLAKKQKLVLAQLMIYDGLDQSKDYGYFYRSNKDLCNDVGISEPTLILALGKLEDMGLIERVRGKRGVGASEYRVFKEKIDDYLNTKKQNFSNQFKRELLEMSDRIRDLENLVSSLKDRISKIEEKNFSTEAESEKETDIELELELEQDYNRLKNKDIIDNNKNNNIKNNILKENIKERIPIQSRTVKVETKASGWIDNLFLDPKDFEDNDSNEESWN
jgi:DNA-binding MarR family transcriptional regulator